MLKNSEISHFIVKHKTDFYTTILFIYNRKIRINFYTTAFSLRFDICVSFRFFNIHNNRQERKHWKRNENIKLFPAFSFPLLPTFYFSFWNRKYKDFASESECKRDGEQQKRKGWGNQPVCSWLYSQIL